MAVFVVVFMSAAAGALLVMGMLMTMLMGMFLLMYMLVAAAAPLMAAAVFCRIFRSVQMFVLFHNYALRMFFMISQDQHMNKCSYDTLIKKKTILLQRSCQKKEQNITINFIWMK